MVSAQMLVSFSIAMVALVFVAHSIAAVVKEHRARKRDDIARQQGYANDLCKQAIQRQQKEEVNKMSEKFLSQQSRLDITEKGAIRILRNLDSMADEQRRIAYLQKLVAMLDDTHLMALDFSMEMTPDQQGDK